MHMRLKRMALAALLVIVPAVVGPSIAMAADAQLYEVTENMKLVQGRVVKRAATSQLGGWAAVGTPLCPSELIDQLVALQVIAVKPDRCSINATGNDSISTQTGKGPFSGRYTVVVQGDNPVDSAEFVVTSGIFKGRMDFSPAILHQVPFGTVTGTLLPGTGGTFPFTGVFRLPFVVPDGNGGYTVPLYLDETFQGVMPVAPEEYSLGQPTVRFEITF
jgi:hypothetical protein